MGFKNGMMKINLGLKIELIVWVAIFLSNLLKAQTIDEIKAAGSERRSTPNFDISKSTPLQEGKTEHLENQSF